MLLWAFLNLAVSIFFWINIKAPLIRGYLLINYVLIVNPAFLWLFFNIAHPQFIPGRDSNIEALVYMVTFNIVLCSSYTLLRRLIPPSGFLIRKIGMLRIKTYSNVVIEMLGENIKHKKLKIIFLSN